MPHVHRRLLSKYVQYSTCRLSNCRTLCSKHNDDENQGTCEDVQDNEKPFVVTTIKDGKKSASSEEKDTPESSDEAISTDVKGFAGRNLSV